MKLTEILKAYSDPTRLRMMNLLANRGPEICVCNIVAALELPQSTVSRQLMMLRHLGVVNDRRMGAWVHYSLERGDSGAQRAMLDLLKCCPAEDPQFAEDLAAFDRVMTAKAEAEACATSSKTCCEKPEVSLAAGVGES